MRCNLGRSLAVAVVVLASVATARDAFAINACTAAQVSANDSSCPSGTGPCTISKNFDVATGCTLDFGTRAVTVTGTINFDSNTITIKSGTFTIAGGGKLTGLGDSGTAPRNNGGHVTIQTTGAVNVNNASTQGKIDVSGNLNAGDIIIVAGGTVTIGGRLLARDLTTNGSGGSIDITSATNIVTQSLAQIDASGGDFGVGGEISFTANGTTIDLGALVDIRGGDGGDLTVFANLGAIIRDIDVSAKGDAGSAGTIDILARSVQMLGLVLANGSPSGTDSGGGDGGDISIEAEFGDITIVGDIFADGAGPDGGGGSLDLTAVGNIVQQLNADISAQAAGSLGFGGEIDVDAGIAYTSNGMVNASGGDSGGDILVLSARDATFNKRVDVTGRNAGGYGGSFFVEAGGEGKGSVTVADRLDASGGVCGGERGCGVAGSLELIGCDVTIGSLAQVLSRAPTAGTIDITSREQLRVQGSVNALATDVPNVNGANTFRHRTGKAPIVTGTVTPPATTVPMATCTAAITTACLTPCPTCGNNIVEYPETCDNNNGTPVSCDGCSAVCQSENCNDGNGCTADSCDPTLGCNHTPTAEGTICDDGNLCNGTDTCHGGFCTSSGTLNCNDNNVCTTDSCVPAIGCVRVNNLLPCSDNLFCNGTDTCGGGTCSTHSGNPCPGPDGDANCAESCNEATDTCTAPDPNGSSCNDNVFCNGTDTCAAGNCSGHSGNPCPGPDGDGNCSESCNEAGANCTAPDPDGSTCTDGLFCTGADSCIGGSCAGHTGDPCPGPDGDVNCSESCNEPTDTCTAADPDGSACPGGTCELGMCNAPTTTTTSTSSTTSTSTSTTSTSTSSTSTSTTSTTLPSALGHLKCYKAKDSRPKVSYTLDLGATIPGFPNEPGCRMKLGSKQICVEVTKQGVTPTPPGTGPGIPPNGGSVFLSYKVKCPKQTIGSRTFIDQFGGGSFTVGSATELLVPAAPGPNNAHFKCYKAKDSRTKTTYTMNLLAGVPGFTNEFGCTAKLGASRVCVQVLKQNVQPVPPGGGPGTGTATGGKFVGYKLKCPKQTLSSKVFTDQFGTGSFLPGAAATLLVPAN